MVNWSRGRPVGSRGRLIGSRSRLVRSRSRLVGGRGRSVWLGLWGNGFPLVLDVSHVALGTSAVGDNLNPPVRQVDPVLPGGVVVGPLLLLGEHGTILRVVHAILVVVAGGHGGVWIRSRGVACRGRRGGTTHQSN